MRTPLAHIRTLAGAVALLLLLAFAPAGAQQPASVNRPQNAVNEQKLLQQLDASKAASAFPTTAPGRSSSRPAGIGATSTR